MQICWNCDAHQINGTIFCTECGASLIKKDERKPQSTTLENPPDKPLSRQQPARITEKIEVEEIAAAQTSQPNNVIYLVPEHGRPLKLSIRKNVMVGRADERKGIQPDIDLGPYGGYYAGVSRQHALISVQNGKYVVRDLTSSNGTFVNNYRIHPSQTIVLNRGDEVRFGKLRLRVEFALPTRQGLTPMCPQRA